PETKATQPELLAHHYTAAGLTAQAIPYWQKAGQRASQRSAYVEAISHLTMGLGLLTAPPDTPERTEQERDPRSTLGPALIATKGYAAPEVEQAFARARELCQQLGKTRQLFGVLRLLHGFYYVRAELRKAHELAAQLFSLAQSVQDPTLLLRAHLSLGFTLYCLGEFVPTRELIEQSIALYDPQRHSPHVSNEVQDFRVTFSLSLGAWVLWVLGYPNQALQSSQEALTLAQELSHPFSLAFARCFAAELHQVRREVQAPQEQAEAIIALCTEHGLPFWLARGTIVRGWALAKQGLSEEGVAQIRQGLAAYR